MDRTTLLPPACLYLRTVLQTHTHILVHAPTPTPHTHSCSVHPSMHSCTCMYMYFFYILSLWIDLQASDIMWTISDTAWILNILASFLETWTAGACTFIHLLRKFDPVVILKVRQDSVCTRSEVAQGLHTPVYCIFFQFSKCLLTLATCMDSIR